MRKRVQAAWNRMLSAIQFFLARWLQGEEKLCFVDIGASAIAKPRFASAFEELEVVAFDPDPRSEDDFKGLDFKVKFLPYGIA